MSCDTHMISLPLQSCQKDLVKDNGYKYFVQVSVTLTYPFPLE
jgi:hypothetical protein